MSSIPSKIAFRHVAEPAESLISRRRNTDAGARECGLYGRATLGGDLRSGRHGMARLGRGVKQGWGGDMRALVVSTLRVGDGRIRPW